MMSVCRHDVVCLSGMVINPVARVYHIIRVSWTYKSIIHPPDRLFKKIFHAASTAPVSFGGPKHPKNEIISVDSWSDCHK